MSRRDLLLRHSAWMQGSDSSTVVLSSRVRLARNLEEAPFPHVLSAEDAIKLEQMLSEVLSKVDVEGQKLSYLSLPELTSIEKQVLLEKHLISPALMGHQQGRGVGLIPDHRVAVMVNEEDHLRLQVLLPGGNLRETYKLATDLDDQLEKELDFAHREAHGYLTACPTNVGTGMRASVMVHLPALVITNQVQQVLGALTQLGLAVRGLYGEGSQAYGHIFQVSNQITLGKSEEDIITHIEAVTGQIVEHELQARQTLNKQARISLEDKVWRARGILANARILTSEELMHLLSEDRLGIDLEILPKLKTSFTTLLVDSLPGCLQYMLDQQLDPSERDEQRARFIRNAITS
ncbi:MAG: protein arginine kinase [Desulfitobacterium hafniense]|nr:protein arginine kinase [Desulfitobacterium hafniense]